jgi:hypothetical protein
VQFDKFANWFRSEACLQRQSEGTKENVDFHGTDSRIKIFASIGFAGKEESGVGALAGTQPITPLALADVFRWDELSGGGAPILRQKGTLRVLLKSLSCD